MSEVTDLYRSVANLVPWHISKIQVARLPAARRLPTNFPYTHRAGIFLHNDDSMTVETEDIRNIVFPRQKFSKAVKYGILVYGYAPDDEVQQEQTTEEVYLRLKSEERK